MMTSRGSLGVAPANFKVAALFCRNRFCGSAVDMSFERGLVVDSATGWSMSDEEQMEEVERRIRDEEPVLLIGSPMCWAFSTLIELTQAGKPSEFERRGAMRHTYETQREDWSCRSIRGMRGLVASVSSMKVAEKDRCAQDERRLVSISVGNEQCRERNMFHVEIKVHHGGVEQALLQQR